MVLGAGQVRDLMAPQIDNPIAPLVAGMLGSEQLQQAQQGYEVVLGAEQVRDLIAPQIDNPIAPLVSGMLGSDQLRDDTE